MRFQKTKPVYAACKRQYTAAGWDIQEPFGDIHERRKAEQGDWCTYW